MRCCKDLGVASELWDPKVSINLIITLRTSCISGNGLFIILCLVDYNSNSFHSLLLNGSHNMLMSCGVRMSELRIKRSYGEEKTGQNHLLILGKK